MDILMLENMSNEFQPTICLMNDEIDTLYFKDFQLFFFSIIKFIFLLITSTGFAIIFISYCLYFPSKIQFEKSYNENKELYEYNPFLIESLEEYYTLDEDKDDEFLKTLINKYISCTFDFKNKSYTIIMNYNYDNEAFDYFLNHKPNVIPFEFLDTISRIYSVKYNCRNIYIDNHDNKIKFFDSLNPTPADNELLNKELQQTKNNIFYSKKSKSHDSKDNILNYTSNKFKYKGLLKDFSDLIIGSEIYDSSNQLITNYLDLNNQIFYIKNDNFEVVSDNKNQLSFTEFKNLST